MFTGEVEMGVDLKSFQTEFPGTLRLLGLPSDIRRGTRIGGELHLEQSFICFMFGRYNSQLTNPEDAGNINSFIV